MRQEDILPWHTYVRTSTGRVRRYRRVIRIEEGTVHYESLVQRWPIMSTDAPGSCTVSKFAAWAHREVKAEVADQFSAYWRQG